MKDIVVSDVAEMTPAGTLTGAWVREAVIPVHQLGRAEPVAKLIVPIEISDHALTDGELATLRQTASHFSLTQIPHLASQAPEVRIEFDGRALHTKTFRQASPDPRDERMMQANAARAAAAAIRSFTRD